MDDKSAPTNTNTVKSLSVEGIHSVEGIPSSAASVSAAEEDQLSRRPTSFTVKTLSVEGSSKAAASVSAAEEDQLLKDGAGKIEVAEGKVDELLGIATMQSWESDQLPVLAASRRDPLGGGVGGNQSVIGFWLHHHLRQRSCRYPLERLTRWWSRGPTNSQRSRL